MHRENKQLQMVGLIRQEQHHCESLILTTAANPIVLLTGNALGVDFDKRLKQCAMMLPVLQSRLDAAMKAASEAISETERKASSKGN